MPKRLRDKNAAGSETFYRVAQNAASNAKASHRRLLRTHVPAALGVKRSNFSLSRRKKPGCKNFDGTIKAVNSFIAGGTLTQVK